jgi:hypothetical protein
MRLFALSVVIAVSFAFAGTALADTDTTPPNITKLKLSNTVFKVGKTNTALITKAKQKAPTGTTIKFTLTESTYIAIGVFRALPGRTVGKDCVKETQDNKRHKKCMRPLLINTMQRIGHPGPNAIPFSGVLDGKTLKVGAYGFGVVASDVAGNSSKPKTRNFSIVK